MKPRLLVATVLATVLIAAMAMAQQTKTPQTPQTPKDKLSYSLGMDASKTLKQRGIEFNLEMFLRGVRDGYSGSKALMTDDEIRAALTGLQKELQQKAEAAAKSRADKAKAEGEKFLAANKAKKGVTTLSDGLQYEILKAGKGAKPTAASTVSVHYVGTTVDGTVFDSSLKRGEPQDLPLEKIIPGWREALLLMPLGSKWRVAIPPALAYKDRSDTPFPPNSVLIFEIELLGIK
jgi:FKBP-type peptidyl-prolyl cis-trans isomerase